MIGTSNWTPDYFLKTGGIGFIFSSNLENKQHNVFSEGELQLKHKQTFMQHNLHQLDDMVDKRYSVASDPSYDVGIENMHKQLRDVFLRDWNSPYTSEDI